MQDPILITGAPRSGTSMIAGIIHICGAFKGDTSGPNKNNQKGMYENAQIRNGIVKPYLREIGVDPKGQFPLPDPHKIPIPNDLRVRVETVMKREGYKGGPWMYKGAKMALTWPMWHYAFPDAKWIIVRRKTSDIINSCMNTGFMNAFSKQENQLAVGAEEERGGWLWWVHQHHNRFIEMFTEGLNAQVVWPERLVKANYEQMKKTVEWLGLEWKGDKVAEFIEPKLWKARNKNKIV